MKQKDILILLVPATIVVFAWIGFSIYHNRVTSTIPENIQVQITPIEPRFDTETLDKIKNRIAVPENFSSSQSSPTARISPSPRISPTITSTPSATPISTPEATLR